jgi:hypothetical protein
LKLSHEESRENTGKGETMRFWNNVNVKEMVTVELKGRQSLDKEEFIGIDA